MARNDGIDRTSARNVDVPDKDIGNTQKHNEREKDSYRNPDIVPEPHPLNYPLQTPHRQPTRRCSDRWSRTKSSPHVV